MQQTEKYQFNLIESSDAFSAQPLNDNAEKVEAALDAVDAALDAHQTQMNTALANHQTQMNTALANYQAQVSAALDGQAAEMAQQFAAQPKIGYVSYTGKGAGSVVLTFPFKPRMVLLTAAISESLACFTAVYGQTAGYRIGGYTGIGTFAMSWSGNTLTVSSDGKTGNPAYYFNELNVGYLAVAFG